MRLNRPTLRHAATHGNSLQHTATTGEDCHAYDKMTSDVLDIVNNVFTGMFLVEMLLKMLGLGMICIYIWLRGYLQCSV